VREWSCISPPLLAREGEWKTADQPTPGGLDRGGRQGVVEIGFAEPGDPQSGRHGVVTQPLQGKFVRDRERDQRVRSRVPVADDIGISNGEIKGRVR
jgi:hypothetical protein